MKQLVAVPEWHLFFLTTTITFRYLTMCYLIGVERKAEAAATACKLDSNSTAPSKGWIPYSAGLSPFVHHLNRLAFAKSSLSATVSVASANSVTQPLSACLVNKQAS